MGKLSLQAAATFKVAVRIPVPGGEADPVEFTFKHRGVAELQQFNEQIKGKKDPEVIGEIICGWDLDDPFSIENVGRLCDTYPAAARTIINAYFEELRGARAKN